jgi:hypothetical protein
MTQGKCVKCGSVIELTDISSVSGLGGCTNCTVCGIINLNWAASKRLAAASLKSGRAHKVGDADG